MNFGHHKQDSRSKTFPDQKSTDERFHQATSASILIMIETITIVHKLLVNFKCDDIVFIFEICSNAFNTIIVDRIYMIQMLHNWSTNLTNYQKTYDRSFKLKPLIKITKLLHCNTQFGKYI